MVGFAGAIRAAAGQPATIRIGVVESVTPVAVSVEGQIFQGDAVGVLSGVTIPAVGESVALVGQSTDMGADPASWLILGGPSSVVARTERATAPATLNTLSTSYVALSTVCGTPFVASANGNEMILWRSYLENSTVGSGCLCAPEIRTGAVVGSGSPVLLANDNRSLLQTGVEQTAMGSQFTIFGLTPGAVYNVQLLQRATANTATFAWREVIAMPIP